MAVENETCQVVEARDEVIRNYVLKKQSVLFKEQRVGGQTRLRTDEE